LKFREDINGLRAIAVMGVVLFHFMPQTLSGGFSGVDIFFVISGFLMTGIIFNGFELRNFSIFKFYRSRVYRIAPALIFLCLSLLFLGWFILIPSDYKVLGKHVTSSLLFFSNVIYLRESGYFDAGSYDKWLLHTWSLSVEWQFYLIYPLIMVALKRFYSIKIMKAIILACAIIGFIVSVIVTYKWTDSAYYLLPTRMWQMLIGGVVFLYPITLKKSNKRYLEGLGILMVLGSYLFLSEKQPWPGYWALVPVLGSVLIILSHREKSNIMGNKIIQRIGLWSYSIYLWHWPIVVLINYYSLSSLYGYFGIVLSIVMGFGSYKYIESIKFNKKFFNGIECKKNKIWRLLPILFLLVVAILGRVVYKTNGLEWHYSQRVIDVVKEMNNKNPRRKECHVGSGKVPECIYGNGDLGAIVIGDSHAQSIIRSVEASLPNNRSVLDWTMSGCRTIENIFHTLNNGLINETCGEFVSYAMKQVSKYPNVPIVIDNRYIYTLLGPSEPELQHEKNTVTEFIPSTASYTVRNEDYITAMNEAFTRTVCKFSENNPVFLLEQTPEFKEHVPKTMAREIIEGNDDFRVKISIKEYQDRNAVLESVVINLREKCHVNYIPVAKHFCDDEYCYGDIDGRPAYFDDDHLSEFGASMLIPDMREQLKPYL
jgi:peptidoglycan/LPS O-acetylase OafA/YrhL